MYGKECDYCGRPSFTQLAYVVSTEPRLSICRSCIERGELEASEAPLRVRVVDMSDIVAKEKVNVQAN